MADSEPPQSAKAADSDIITKSLKRVARELLSADPDAVTINKARQVAENKLGLDTGFFKRDIEWKARSKQIIEAVVNDETEQTPHPASMPSTSGCCQFLDKLPAELRNNIYELVLLAEIDSEGFIAVRARTEEDPPNCVAILQTCHQIRDEARGIFTNAAVLRFTQSKHVAEYMNSIPESLANDITTIHIDICGWPLDHKWSRTWSQWLVRTPKLTAVHVRVDRRSAHGLMFNYGHWQKEIMQLSGLSKFSIKVVPEENAARKVVINLGNERYWHRALKNVERAITGPRRQLRNRLA